MPPGVGVLEIWAKVRLAGHRVPDSGRRAWEGRWGVIQTIRRAAQLIRSW